MGADKPVDEFKQEVAALLELAREVSMKHRKSFSLTIFQNGNGWVSGGRISPMDLDIGYDGTGTAKVKGGEE